MRRSHLLLSAALFCAIALSACDAPADDDLPAAKAEAPADAKVTGDVSSMDETSPAGEAVTEEEIPKSDVPPPPREVFSDSGCSFEAWVGRPLDEAAVKATGRPYRVLTPDSMMTMDHNPERINVVQEGGKVTRVWCG